MTKVVLSAPFAKTVETEDGGREVWGFASLELKDKSNEIADFAGTVKAFEKWSQDTEQRTGGKSKGNVRVMHQPITAGKTIHWEPTETTVQDEEGNDQTVKGIWVGAYVPPTKQDVIRDIDEGILSAFSIGGAYEKRWWSQDDNAFRYIPELSEYSLVDNPCVPGADIVSVIQKSGGPWNRKEGEEVKKTSEARGTYEELHCLLNRAVDAKLGGGYWFDGYIVATYPAKVVVYDWDSSKYFELSYSFDGDTVTLGDAVEVTIEYVPLEAQKDAETQKAARSEFIDEAITRFNENVEKADADQIGMRIAKAATQLKGGEYIFENGRVVEKREGENVDLEQIKKAAEAAGLNVEQVQAFFKALTPIDQPPAPVSVTTVDGDGDKDKNKEFPSPPSGDEKIDIEGAKKDFDQSEKDSGITIKAAEGEVTKADVTPDDNSRAEKAAPAELEKAGKAISNKNGAHLLHAANHIGAVMKGADYTADDHLVVESQVGQGGTGEEAPEVDVEKVFANIFTPIIEATVKKATDALLQKSAESNKGLSELSNQFESLAKGLASQDSLKKAMDEIESIKSLVKEIHETPQVGGPILNGGSPDLAFMSKGFNQANVSQIEIQALEKFAKETKDPLVKDRVGQEIARRAMNDVFKQ